MELASILGVRDGDSKLAGHVDVAQMLLREPRLLTADVQQVTRRLFQLRVKMPGQLDIARLLMQQPSLLLTDFEELQCAFSPVMNGVLPLCTPFLPPCRAVMQQAVGLQKVQKSGHAFLMHSQSPGGRIVSAWGSEYRGGGLYSTVPQRHGNSGHVYRNASAHDLIPALSHGLPSDTASDWDNRYQQLIDYKQQQGDVHCGFRDGDESGLARWCKKQRSDYSKANLTREQIAKLHDVGFELDSEAAEWMCWYSELKRFHRENGKSADWEPFTAQHQMYLTNWCSVQRIARRSGVMPHDRIQKLDDLDFQWSGADPLS